MLFFKKGTSIQLILTLIPVFILVGFRDSSVGEDSSGYLAIYENMNISSLSFAISESPYEEVGFNILSWMLRIAGVSPQWLFIVEAFIFCFSIYLFCSINAKDKIFVAVAIILSLFEFSLSGVRQTFAISILLIAFSAIAQKRIITYFILVSLAISFHTSALLLAPLYFLSGRGFEGKTILLYLIILGLSYLFIDSIFSRITTIIYTDQYVLMGLRGGVFSFLASFAFALIPGFYYRQEKNNQMFILGSHFTMLWFLFSAIRFINVMMSRVILYILPMPYLMIDSMNDGIANKKAIKILALLYVFIMFVYRIKLLSPFVFGHV